MIRKLTETQAPPSAAAPLGLCFWLFYIINICGNSLYIPYMFYIYIYTHNIKEWMSRNKEHRPNGAAAEGGRPIGAPPKAAPVFLIILYHKCLWIFLIYSLYIPYIFPRYVPYISLVCFLIYGVKSRSGHDRSQSFGPISHVSGPKLTFWGIP